MPANISPTAIGESYVDVLLETIRTDEPLPFPLYTEIQGTRLIYRKAGETFTTRHAQQVRAMGLRSLVAPASALTQVLDYLHSAFGDLLDDDELSGEEKMSTWSSWLEPRPRLLPSTSGSQDS